MDERLESWLDSLLDRRVRRIPKATGGPPAVLLEPRRKGDPGGDIDRILNLPELLSAGADASLTGA
jgi:hypothetical protein